MGGVAHLRIVDRLTAIHTALERFYDRKLPECPTEGELLGFLYEEWDGSGFEGMDRDEQLRWYRHAQEVLLRFHARTGARLGARNVASSAFQSKSRPSASNTSRSA
jgi:hypothetical protein